MSYNPLRQLMEVQDWIGLTKIQNDALGRAVKVTYPDKREVSYTYGKAGRETKYYIPGWKNGLLLFDDNCIQYELTLSVKGGYHRMQYPFLTLESKVKTISKLK